MHRSHAIIENVNKPMLTFNFLLVQDLIQLTWSTTGSDNYVSTTDKKVSGYSSNMI